MSRYVVGWTLAGEGSLIADELSRTDITADGVVPHLARRPGHLDDLRTSPSS